MTESSETQAARVDGTKIWVPITTVGTAVALVFGAHMYLQSQFLALNVQLQQLNVKVERLEDKVSDRWTQADMQAWVFEFSRANPSLNVPPAVKDQR